MDILLSLLQVHFTMRLQKNIEKIFEKILETLEQFGLSHAIYSRGVTLLYKIRR